MLDIKFIRENPEKVKEGALSKGVKADVDAILRLDKRRRESQTKLEELLARKNRATKTISASKSPKEKQTLIKEMKTVDSGQEKIKKILMTAEDEFQEKMRQLPNIPFDDVPRGKNESDNVVLREFGEKPSFDFKEKDYLSISEGLDIIDVKRAAKISGSRFGFLKGEAARLEAALLSFVFDVLGEEGFVPVVPPVMIKEEMARGMGYLEQTGHEEAYFLPKDNLFLVGTSEQALGTMHSDEVFGIAELPRRYIGFSSCFRREAGSYGKDTKGILRAHQFDKAEMFSIVAPELSEGEHQFLLKMQETLMQKLGLHYRVAEICTGDMGRPAARQYDLETWIPSEGRYRETHSTSNCTDFQARRLNIRYRKSGKGEGGFVHMLNGTAIAMGRTIIAIIENYQQKDGSVKIPKVLQKYLPFGEIKPRL